MTAPGSTDGAAPPPATPKQVLAALVAAGATVAVAESLTGGLLTAALTEPAGASNAVRGGLVVYATDLKATLAGVPVPLLAAEGPVSPDVAGALAAGARDRLGATYGLGADRRGRPGPAGRPPGRHRLRRRSPARAAAPSGALTALGRPRRDPRRRPSRTPPTWPSCWPRCGSRGPAELSA